MDALNNAQAATEAMRADPRYLGPMETWPQPEGAQDMTPERRAAVRGDAERNAAPRFVEEEPAKLSRVKTDAAILRYPKHHHPVDVLFARLRRWLRGAP